MGRVPVFLPIFDPKLIEMITKGMFSVLIGVGSVFMARGQSVSGLTGKADTSFTTFSAYVSSKRSHPEIRIVKEQQDPLVAEKRGISYCRIGQRDLYIDAFYPAERKKLNPAIVIIHGGGWRSGNSAQHIPLAQRLASKGFSCFTVEYRLSTEALYPAAVVDLKAAIRWVRANSGRFNVDSTRIVALGFSAGGELASFLGATNAEFRFDTSSCNSGYSSKVQAVVDIDGILAFTHPESGEGGDSKSPSAATYWLGYPRNANPQLWKDASPLTHVDRNAPPFLFINSSVARMHAGRDDFKKILAQNGIYSETHEYENAPHAFCLFEPWFTPTVEYIARFINRVFSLVDGTPH